ncbi:type II toxin-antitoxin system HicB family antitoxin [Gloeocapsopsis dulcis]|uniref:HicB family protein n=1 Tax=Gloeocapsopsis dulcis AAB1 = 1H9 TaxID=1433147 RepID=A0A6N8G033_9CHRO|nr:type II toxin-antitoxin system HicB family antitoxin [Gloeocapsopsis dulcis]MUL37516.1 HicB family protein [Gloeocapsopsis dulcis AAB1 = 1H9]WNN89461.1 type II toxin-antitoxin system HicB family antitoxin [Gloeocapsopsis dulcis]
MTPHYSILIQWSDEDQVYIASLPEFGPYVRTHGNTYKEALESAEELLETMCSHYQDQGKALPQPALAG